MHKVAACAHARPRVARLGIPLPKQLTPTPTTNLIGDIPSCPRSCLTWSVFCARKICKVHLKNPTLLGSGSRPSDLVGHRRCRENRLNV